MHRNANILRDYTDGVLNGVIVLCDTTGYWSGYNKQLIKNHISDLYSIDMRMTTRPLGGFSYEYKNDILLVNFYCLTNHFKMDLFKTCIDKLLKHHFSITNTDINTVKYGIVLPDHLDKVLVEAINKYVDSISNSFYLYLK